MSLVCAHTYTIRAITDYNSRQASLKGPDGSRNNNFDVFILIMGQVFL